MSYRKYLASGIWRCDESPTGAHYWREMVQTKKLAAGGYFMCRYCHNVKRFPIVHGTALSGESELFNPYVD